MVKTIIRLSVIVICVLTPSFAFADTTLYSQLLDGGRSHGDQSYFNQEIGTGLSGIVKEISVELTASSTAQVWTMGVEECSSSAYNDCVQVGVSAPNTVSVAQTKVQMFFEMSTVAVLNPAKYYRLFIQADNSGCGIPVCFFQMFGSQSDVWPGHSHDNFGATSEPLMYDWFFVLNGVSTVSDLSKVVQVVSPLNNSTSTDGHITFDTKYYAAVGNQVSRWYFQISDRTTNDADFGGVPITIFGTASNGNFEVVRDLVLNEGHDYIFTPTLYSSTTRITYGGHSVFFHVGSTTVTYFPTSTSSPPTSSNGYETTTPTDVGSIPVIVNYVQGNVAVNALVHIFPFSYIYDSLVIVSELEGATTTSGVISFVTPSLFGHQPTTTPFVIANFNSLPDKDLIDSIRYWIAAALWIMFAMYVPWIILKAL